MKLHFAKLLVAAALVGIAVPRTFAADLIVEENGVLPNYATIQSAVTAAVAGDRIFVKNKAGNVPYQENVTINKSISILAYDPDGVYYVFGNYTINPVANAEVNIIGMYNQSGSVASSANGVLTTPTRVNFLNSTLVSGNFNTNHTGFVSHVAGNNLMAGGITTKTATITGNQVTGGISITDIGGTVTGYPEDTLYIVGNRLATAAGGYATGGISWTNDDDYFFIANNWIRQDGNNITISSGKAGAGANVIENNSMESLNSYNNGVYLAYTVLAGTTIRVVNNAFFDENAGECCSTTEYAVLVSTINAGAFVSVDYNIYRNYRNGFTNASAAIVSMTGNIAGTTFNPNDVTGECNSPECVDDGGPSTDYTDLDLTRNDIGTLGGSYNFNNFWPNQTGGARVYLVKTPRTVVQSSTINAKADSYDR